jgi:hypothetical protein
VAHTLAKKGNSSRSATLQALTTPLSFLGLALLIIEATLAIVLSNQKLSEAHIWAGFLWMIAIFAAIVLVAVIFFWVKPQNLLFGKEELANPPLDPSALNDAIEDLIVGNVKPECLKNPPS